MLSNRYVRTVILSRVLLHLGIWIRNYAVLLYVTQITQHNPVYVSWVSVAEFAPIFLFGLIGGAFADRWQPKRTMVWSDVLSGLSAGAVLLAVTDGGWMALLIGTFISACLSQFSQPSAMKLFKQQVPTEQLQRVMALTQTLVAVFTVLGPAIGTFIFLQFGIQVSLILTAMLFLGSALILSSLPRDVKEEQPAKAGGLLREITDGLRYIGSNPSLRTLCLTFSAVGLATGIIQPLQIFLVIENLGQDPSVLQWLVMASGAAMLVGGAVIVAVASTAKPQHLLMLGLLVTAVCTGVIGMSTHMGLTIALLIISGLVYPCIQGGIQTLLVRNTEGAYMGRVSGTIMPIFMGMMVSGMFLSAYLKQSLSLPGVYIASGVLVIIGALMLLPIVIQKRSNTEKTNTAA